MDIPILVLFTILHRKQIPKEKLLWLLLINFKVWDWSFLFK